ncbi:hypothetical protein C8Q78DRAFT_242121 [Trametes maxima]|nr:hypothetical protein C8Q78DRAFT_242121 [Trametes maxima]
MTGTPTFMATEVLVAIRDGPHLTRTRYHDLESFIWVVLYVIYQRYVRRDTGAAAWKYHEYLFEEKTRLFSASDLQQLVSQRRGSFGDSISTASGIHYLLNFLIHLEEAEGALTENICLAVRSLWRILRSLQRVKDIPVHHVDKSEKWQMIQEEMRKYGFEVDEQGGEPSDSQTDGEGINSGEGKPDIAGAIEDALEWLTM